jgi:hypothetical protein
MTIIGRLADTPELQATSTGQEILRYAVGTNSGPRDNQKTSWFRVTSFLPEGPQRDFIASLDKGFVLLSSPLAILSFIFFFFGLRIPGKGRDGRRGFRRGGYG